MPSQCVKVETAASNGLRNRSTVRPSKRATFCREGGLSCQSCLNYIVLLNLVTVWEDASVLLFLYNVSETCSYAPTLRVDHRIGNAHVNILPLLQLGHIVKTKCFSTLRL